MTDRDIIELKLKPQHPTFTDEIDDNNDNNKHTHRIYTEHTLNEEEIKKELEREEENRPKTVLEIDGKEVLDRLLENNNLNDLTGTESMSILALFLEELIWVTEKIENKEISIIELNEEIFGDSFWEEVLNNLNDNEIIEEIKNSKNNENDKEKLKLISKSQEELGVSIRKNCKIFSNFEIDNDNERIDIHDLKKFIKRKVGKYEKCCKDTQMIEWISNKFYLKSAPKMDIRTYINRINSHLDVSGAVGLCAGWFLFKYIFNLRCDELLSDGIRLENLNEINNVNFENRRLPLVFGNSFKINENDQVNAQYKKEDNYQERIQEQGNINNTGNHNMEIDSVPLSQSDSVCSSIITDDEEEKEEEEEEREGGKEEGLNQLIPVNKRNAFRLALTTIRIACKLVEDKNYRQEYYCKVSGLQRVQDLFRLELALGYALEWSLFANTAVLLRYVRHVHRFVSVCHNMRQRQK